MVTFDFIMLLLFKVIVPRGVEFEVAAPKSFYKKYFSQNINFSER